MMEPIKTRHTTNLLGAPKDWDASKGECRALPVHLDRRYGRFLSWYQPTEQDIANILAGLPIRLSIYSFDHPPVAIDVTDSIEG